MPGKRSSGGTSRKRKLTAQERAFLTLSRGLKQATPEQIEGARRTAAKTSTLTKGDRSLDQSRKARLARAEA